MEKEVVTRKGQTRKRTKSGRVTVVQLKGYSTKEGARRRMRKMRKRVRGWGADRGPFFLNTSEKYLKFSIKKKEDQRTNYKELRDVDKIGGN